MNPQQFILLLGTAPTGRVFGLDQQTLIQIGIQLFNAGILAAVLAFILYNPVRNYLQRRSDSIKAQFDRATHDMSTANELRAQYERKLFDIELERDEILSTARKLAVENSRRALIATQNEAEAIRARVSVDLQLEQQRVQDEMKQSIIDVSSVMATKIIAHSMNEESLDRVFDETMSELEEMVWRN